MIKKKREKKKKKKTRRTSGENGPGNGNQNWQMLYKCLHIFFFFLFIRSFFFGFIMSLSYTCPIIQLGVLPYQHLNNGVWYPIHIKLQNHSYELKYRFSDFVRFSRAIQQRFNIDRLEPINPTFKSRLLSIIHKTKHSAENNNQKYTDRQLQLERFCAQLVLLPSQITCSHLFLSFFSASKQQQVQLTMALNNSHNTIKRIFSTLKSKKDGLQYISNRLSQQSTTSNSSHGDSSSMTRTSSNQSSAMLSDEIKVKIIYDDDNIIIIRVTRAIPLDQLRSQIIQKFALLRIPLPDQLAFFDLTENDPLHGSEYDGMISDECQLRAVMQQKWVCLQKVTLQCII